MGYHLRKINKGVYGESSKITEEYEEFLDAEERGAKLMELVELSDLIGAIQGYLHKYHPSIRLEDLQYMAELTKSAFEEGQRK